MLNIFRFMVFVIILTLVAHTAFSHELPEEGTVVFRATEVVDPGYQVLPRYCNTCDLDYTTPVILPNTISTESTIRIYTPKQYLVQPNSMTFPMIIIPKEER